MKNTFISAMYKQENWEILYANESLYQIIKHKERRAYSLNQIALFSTEIQKDKNTGSGS